MSARGRAARAAYWLAIGEPERAAAEPSPVSEGAWDAALAAADTTPVPGTDEVAEEAWNVVRLHPVRGPGHRPVVEATVAALADLGRLQPPSGHHHEWVPTRDGAGMGCTSCPATRERFPARDDDYGQGAEPLTVAPDTEGDW